MLKSAKCFKGYKIMKCTKGTRTDGPGHEQTRRGTCGGAGRSLISESVNTVTGPEEAR